VLTIADYDYLNYLFHIDNMVSRFDAHCAGADPGFQARGAHLKKLRRAEGGAKIFGVFRVKNHDFTPKNHIFSNFRGRTAPPPESAPAVILIFIILLTLISVPVIMAVFLYFCN
jgi:hypothetical protein